jgi:hypothetical protein
MKKRTLATYWLLGLLALSAGGRLIYIEIARWDMNDYQRKYDEAIASEGLKEKWGEKVNKFEKDWTDLMPEDKPCSLNQETKLKWEDDAMKYTGLTVDGEEECNRVRQKSKEWLEANKEMGKNELGTYEIWVFKQTGLEKFHRWLKYPKDLRDRIERGEKGLMIGKFWEYIL